MPWRTAEWNSRETIFQECDVPSPISSTCLTSDEGSGATYGQLGGLTDWLPGSKHEGQCDDFINHLSCSGTQRGTHTDCFYPTVGNEFDFDDPSDRNLGDGARRPISDIDVNRLSTVNSLHSLDPNRLGKFQIISFNTLGSLVSSITSPGQPSDHFWKYSMKNGQLGSCGDECEVGTRGFTALGKKGLEYFDATRPPGAAAA